MGQNNPNLQYCLTYIYLISYLIILYIGAKLLKCLLTGTTFSWIEILIFNGFIEFFCEISH